MSEQALTDSNVSTPEVKQSEVIPKEKFSWIRFLSAVLTWICRLCVGGVFIYSGFVKAVDPWGTIFKMKDYLAVMPDSISSFCEPLVSVGCFSLFAFEFLIGLFLLTGSYRKISTIGAGLLMLFMLPLTLWIALTDPVADCGCFGDALIISNWATFWKNVVLTMMIAWLLKMNERCRCLVHPTLQWLLFAAGLTFIMTIGFLGYSVQPLIDYRPYPVGEKLIDTDTEEDADMMAVWERNGEKITIAADSIPEGNDWVFVERITSGAAKSGSGEVKEKVKGLAIYDDAEEITADVIEQSGEQVIVTMTDLPSISTGSFYTLNSLYAYCSEHEIPMFALVAGTPVQIEDFVDLSLAEYPIYTAEDTAIKEIVRGNPAVIYLENGKIVWKTSLQSIPAVDFMETTPDTPNALRNYKRDTDNWLRNLIIGGIIVVLALILLSHIPLVIKATLHRRSKSKYGKYIKDGAIVKILTLVLCSTLFACHNDTPDLPLVRDKKQAVLIYMVATNSLQYNAISDLREMRTGYVDAESGVTDYIIYLTHPSNDQPVLQRLEWKNGEAVFSVIKTYDTNVSSVDPSRISQVINDFNKIAEQENVVRKGLILWSHSTAWLPGNLIDTTDEVKIRPQYSYGDDYGKTLGIVALANAIPDNLFDFIWCDCCFMGNIETAYELRNDCKYFVGSPTEVMASGLPYDIVIPMMAKENFSLSEICEQVYDWHIAPVENRQHYYTVGVIDMQRLQNLAEAAKEILAPVFPFIYYSDLQTFGSNSKVTFYDAQQTFTRVAEEKGLPASQLEEMFESAVIYKCATSKFLYININPSYYSGLSCSIYPLLDDRMKEEYRRLAWYKFIFE